ncbi:MAG: hypothetical protein CVT63_02750 [Candidatus Anoxymicrobium japonicum]|uniref:Uncharacterized protein n=1 Tax=Candidatus Anoxymicrobium japonicum TaxID=2013648 RepID=A0A2N3G6U6_9ACTN|nr:MAG: hypothetical protein CVT63_02750 [Candidatus Anoxymicrobium japonicum]
MTSFSDLVVYLPDWRNRLLTPKVKCGILVYMEIDTSRLRKEDYACLVAGYALLISIFLPWYRQGIFRLSGWDVTKLAIILMIASFVCILIVIATAIGIDFAEEYGFALVALGAASLVSVVARVFVRQSGYLFTYGIILALLASIAVVVAGGVKLARMYLLPTADHSM